MDVGRAAVHYHCCRCKVFFTMSDNLLAGGSEEGVLLAVRVVDHAVDVDLFAHVHGQNECEPAGAEVGAWLDPGGKTHTRDHVNMKTSFSVKEVVGNLEAPACCSWWPLHAFHQCACTAADLSVLNYSNSCSYWTWLWKWNPSEDEKCKFNVNVNWGYLLYDGTDVSLNSCCFNRTFWQKIMVCSVNFCFFWCCKVYNIIDHHHHGCFFFFLLVFKIVKISII